MTRYATHAEYREAWAAAGRGETPAVPLNVDIELASVCNLSCPMCFISDSAFDAMISGRSSDGLGRRRLMNPVLAETVIAEASRMGVPALKFNWRGESTLHPEFFQIIDYAAGRRTFHELLVNTNANCKDHAIDGLMRATKVMVSLDSMVPATYQLMRAGGRLERALEVIAELVRRGHPNLWVRRVLTRANQAEPFAATVRERFPTGVKISEHYCYDRNEAQRLEMPGCEHDGERTYCGYPSQRIVVSSSGLCYPCCIDLHETMPIGDVRKDSLADIWAGKDLRALRETLIAGQAVTEACKGCRSWMSYRAPQRNFVQDVEVRV